MTYSVLSSNLTTHNSACRGARPPFSLSLVAALFLGVLGTVSTGWGSIDRIRDEVDVRAVRNYILFQDKKAGQILKEQAESSGSLIERSKNVSVQVMKEGHVIINYFGRFDHADTPLEDLITSPKVKAKNLVDALGMDQRFFNRFIEGLEDIDALPLSVVENYVKMDHNHSAVFNATKKYGDKTVYRLAGGPVILLELLREHMALSAASKGRSIELKGIVFGAVPQFTISFFRKMGIELDVLDLDPKKGFVPSIKSQYPKAAKMIDEILKQ